MKTVTDPTAARGPAERTPCEHAALDSLHAGIIALAYQAGRADEREAILGGGHPVRPGRPRQRPARTGPRPDLRLVGGGA